ncbi:MAG: hypothetical protein II820_00645 [Ruminiclostridium sp.]|nr:hypothetical protein [Ruminiclostridium sp.]
MKKKILTVVSVIVLCAMIFCTTGCELFGEKEPPAPDIRLEQLIGSWSRDSSFGKEIYSFSKAMRFTKNTGSVVTMGKFSIEGSTLTLEFSEKGNTKEHTVRFSGDKNEIMTWGWGSTKLEFTKQ